MDSRIKRHNQLGAIVIFFGLPLLFYALGDFPRRTLLKEGISILIILAYFSMLMQFYMSRANQGMLQSGNKMGKVIKWHKVLGYVFVSVLLVHPFLIVFPRYFEAGVYPVDAFKLLITTLGSKGITLGITAWFLMVIIGLTSIFRNHMGLKYKTWRTIHGILSILFIASSSFHVVVNGRHINETMTILIAILSIVGVALLLRIYLFKSVPSKYKQNG